jgi:hypothetical protein
MGVGDMLKDFNYQEPSSLLPALMEAMIAFVVENGPDIYDQATQTGQSKEAVIQSYVNAAESAIGAPLPHGLEQELVNALEHPDEKVYQDHVANARRLRERVCRTAATQISQPLKSKRIQASCLNSFETCGVPSPGVLGLRLCPEEIPPLVLERHKEEEEVRLDLVVGKLSW